MINILHADGTMKVVCELCREDLEEHIRRSEVYFNESGEETVGVKLLCPGESDGESDAHQEYVH